MEQEKMNELIQEAQQERMEEPYQEWKNDNEEELKRDYLYQFNLNELAQLVIDTDDDYFKVHEDSFDEFCREAFNKEGDF